MLRHMKEIPAAYRVEITPDSPVSVDPDAFDPAETTLVRVRDGVYLFRWHGRSIPLHVTRTPDGRVHLWTGHRAFDAVVRNRRDQLLAAWGFQDAASGAAAELVAPMPGLVLSVAVQPGDDVDAGAPLLVLEAMKMENELRADAPVRIAAVRVVPGEAVSKGQVLIEYAP